MNEGRSTSDGMQLVHLANGLSARVAFDSPYSALFYGLPS
jgi:hypothetical protein